MFRKKEKKKKNCCNFFTSVWYPSKCYWYNQLLGCGGPRGRGPFGLPPSRGVSSSGGAIGLVHEEWRGVGEICGHFPARVKAGGTGCKSEKKKRSDCSLFLGLCHIFSSHPSCFLLPGASRRHLPGYFSRRKKSQANPPQWDWWVEGKGRAGQERGGRHTWEVGSGKKSGDRGVQGRRPRRPVSRQPPP